MQTARKLGEIFLRREPESVSRSRAMVRELLGPDHPAYERVRLAVSELTTNAVEHSTPGPVGDLVMVVLKVVNDFIYVEVTDPGSASGKPCLKDPSPDAEDGRGLFIVDELSAGNWGVRDFGAIGRTVWCAIPAEPTAPVEEAAVLGVRPEWRVRRPAIRVNQRKTRIPHSTSVVCMR